MSSSLRWRPRKRRRASDVPPGFPRGRSTNSENKPSAEGHRLNRPTIALVVGRFVYTAAFIVILEIAPLRLSALGRINAARVRMPAGKRATFDGNRLHVGWESAVCIGFH